MSVPPEGLARVLNRSSPSAGPGSDVVPRSDATGFTAATLGHALERDLFRLPRRHPPLAAGRRLDRNVHHHLRTNSLRDDLTSPSGATKDPTWKSRTDRPPPRAHRRSRTLPT
jgi:hypothetical protein